MSQREIIFLLGLLFVAACSKNTPDPQELRFGTTFLSTCNGTGNARGILNGITDNGCSLRGAVALFSAKAASRQDVFCTGVLIEKDVVLTAAHCLSPDIFSTYGSTILAGTSGSLPVLAVDHLRHPDFVDSGTSLSRADIAVILLRTSVEDAPLYEMSSAAPQAGERGIAVGYGLDGKGSDGDGGVGRRLYTVLQVSQIDTESFVGLTGTKTQTCGGDSGGPFLVGGIVRGILSGGDYAEGGNGRCVDALSSVYTNVGSFRAWVQTAVATLRGRH